MAATTEAREWCLQAGNNLWYLQDQDSERAASCLDQAGVSTSTQVTLNVKTDLGGAESSSSLQAQGMLDGATSQAVLQKVRTCSRNWQQPLPLCI